MRWELWPLWHSAKRYFSYNSTERGDSGRGWWYCWVEEKGRILEKLRQLEIVGQSTVEEGVCRERVQISKVPTWDCCWKLNSTCIGWNCIRLESCIWGVWLSEFPQNLETLEFWLDTIERTTELRGTLETPEKLYLSNGGKSVLLDKLWKYSLLEPP